MSYINRNLQLVNTYYVTFNGHPNRMNVFRDPTNGNRFILNSTRKAITSIKMNEIVHINATIADENGGMPLLENPWVSKAIETRTASVSQKELDI